MSFIILEDWQMPTHLLGDQSQSELNGNYRAGERLGKPSINKISELVDKHPAETLSILRCWMYQES